MGARTRSGPTADPVPPRAAVRIEDHPVHRLRPHALERTDAPRLVRQYPSGWSHALLAAVIAACANLAEDATPAAVLRTAAGAFANANPSTMAALVGGALLAAAREIGDVDDVDLKVALTIGTVAAESIATRGKSHVGEKTILDALVPALEAMETASDDALAAGIRAAGEGIEQTRSLQSMRGRASWLGERSKGLRDPGATAFLRLLEGLDVARQA